MGISRRSHLGSQTIHLSLHHRDHLRDHLLVLLDDFQTEGRPAIL